VPPTTATTSTSAATPARGVAVPDVVGVRFTAARATLRAAALLPHSLNAPCRKSPPASQSVVSSLSLPGRASDGRVDAVPLSPGSVVPVGSRIGITWSGCYGDASDVPAVVGLTMGAARHAIHAVGLTWACYSVGHVAPTTTSSSDASASTTAAVTVTVATTAKVRQTVLTQNPAAHSVVRPGTTVSLTMRHCPQ
jgi:beta-lactam-binding protein with PASTA domain